MTTHSDPAPVPFPPGWPRSQTEVIADLTRQLDRFFKACDALMTVSDKVLVGRQLPNERPSDAILIMEASRSAKTYMAGLLLCKQGFGQQAAMLARSVFESMLVCRWTGGHRESAPERWEKHERFLRVLLAEAWTKHGHPDRIPDPPTLGEDERRELERMFGRFGTRSWTGHSALAHLVKDVEDLWDSTWARKQLWMYLDIVNRDSNLHMHSTPVGMAATISVTHGELNYVDLGPSDRGVRNALMALSGSYLWHLSFTNDEFGLGAGADIQSVGRQLWEAGAESNAMQLATRNDLCPCGGELKFKRCHGRE